MTWLPSTTTKGVNRRWPLYVLVAVALVALALSVEAFLRAENFSPREEIISPSIRDVAVSAKNSLYPPPDVSRFQGRPENVFVYLSVEDLPNGEDMEARVERMESGSVFSWIFGGEAEIEVLDEQEDQLSGGENGATGIVKFALRTKSGEPLPSGNYTLNIYMPGSAGEERDVAVRKSFIVEG